MFTRRFFKSIFIGVVFAAFSLALLTACVQTPAAAAVETGNPFATHTAAAQMVQATQTALAIVKTQTALDSQGQAVQATQTAVVANDGVDPTPTSIPPTSTPTNTPAPAAPAATATPATCSNAAALISENYPDDTAVTPGQSIEKIWKIQNTGTCTWTTKYQIAVLNATLKYSKSYAEGWRMPVTVKPGQQVSIPFKFSAPYAAGTYEASLMLVSPDGKSVFGVGTKAKTALSISVKVADITIPQKEDDLKAALNLGAPTWDYGFSKDDGRWALKIASNEQAKFWLDNGQLAMMAKEVPSYRWVIGTQVPSYSQFVQVTFTNGATCAGADGFGLVLRAENLGNGVYNRAYVFQFTCDGRYRLYYMNDGEPVDTIPLTASPFINAGPNQVNRMSVLMLGTKFAVYANGEKIVELTNTWPRQHTGFYGLMVTSEQTEFFTVFADNFKLWRLD